MEHDDIGVATLDRLAGWVDKGRVAVDMIDTPFGKKVDISAPGPDYHLESNELDSLHAVVNEWKDGLVDLIEGDLGAISDVREEVWEEVVIVRRMRRTLARRSCWPHAKSRLASVYKH